MRIALVLPSLVRAGMEVITADLAVRLSERGHQVSVTCVQEEGVLASKLRGCGIPVQLVDVSGLRSNVLTGRLRRHFRELQPDVVHSHSGVWLKAARAARQEGVRGVIHTIHGVHDVERYQDRLMMRAGAAWTDLVCTVSHPLAEYMRHQVGLPRMQVRTLLNGVDEKRFSPVGARLDLNGRIGIPEQALVFGHVARFSRVKDHASLIDAFARVVSVRHDAHLVLVGDGELRSSIEAQIRALALESRVHLMGAVEKTEDAYRAFDVFVLPSLNEGTSISLLEALATGLPVIATAVGGNPALVAHDLSGLLVPSANPASLAEAMRRLSDDEPARRSMGKAARQHVLAELTLDRMTDRYEDVYVAVTTISEGVG